MERSYEIRIYPNARQRELIGRTFGCCRYVYNRALAMRQEEYGRNGKSRGIGSYMTQLPVWKKTDAPFLAEVDSMALQQSLRDLDRAYQTSSAIQAGRGSRSSGPSMQAAGRTAQTWHASQTHAM